jgi:hypothetical protein
MLGDETKVMMLYTEDEARAKLCPLLHASCCAPDCIAWASNRNAGPFWGYCVLIAGTTPAVDARRLTAAVAAG